MAIEITFTCNVCGEEYHTNDLKIKVPVGWGSIKPTLRVKMPNWMDAKTKKDKKLWDDLDDAKEKLKKQLELKEYHLCCKCLRLSQDKILKIEQQKKGSYNENN